MLRAPEGLSSHVEARRGNGRVEAVRGVLGLEAATLAGSAPLRARVVHGSAIVALGLHLGVVIRRAGERCVAHAADLVIARRVLEHFHIVAILVDGAGVIVVVLGVVDRLVVVRHDGVYANLLRVAGA